MQTDDYGRLFGGYGTQKTAPNKQAIFRLILLLRKERRDGIA